LAFFGLRFCHGYLGTLPAAALEVNTKSDVKKSAAFIRPPVCRSRLSPPLCGTRKTGKLDDSQSFKY
jgi:hypothetical protein